MKNASDSAILTHTCFRMNFRSTTYAACAYLLTSLVAFSQGARLTSDTTERNYLLRGSTSRDARQQAEAAVQPLQGQPVPVASDTALDVTRPPAEYPAVLKPKDFFGRSYQPSADYYDPFNNNLQRAGLPSGPGDKAVIQDNSAYIQVEPFSVAEISVAEEFWVTLVLMRDGELVFPRAKLVGEEGILQVKRSSEESSPYLYLRAAPGRTELAGNYLMTTLDVEVLDKVGNNKVLVYKFKVRVVPASDKSLSPTVKVDMVNAKLPPVFGTSGSRAAPIADASAAAVQVKSSMPSSKPAAGRFSPGSAGFSDGRKFTREDTREYFPLMIGMAKAYDEAVAANSPGYSANDIIRFIPATVSDRQIIRGKVPAFDNAFDGQRYFVMGGYFFPRYDAILYEVTWRNRSSETTWWDYSLLRVVPGAEPSYQQVIPTVVSPEYGETTPPDAVNTLWVLVQGNGWTPETPIRLAFPNRGMDNGRVPLVQPHLATPKDGKGRASLYADPNQIPNINR